MNWILWVSHNSYITIVVNLLLSLAKKSVLAREMFECLVVVCLIMPGNCFENVTYFFLFFLFFLIFFFSLFFFNDFFLYGEINSPPRIELIFHRKPIAVAFYLINERKKLINPFKSYLRNATWHFKQSQTNFRFGNWLKTTQNNQIYLIQAFTRNIWK